MYSPKGGSKEYLSIHNSGHVLRNTPADVLHFHSNKIYYHLKYTLSYCLISNLMKKKDNKQCLSDTHRSNGQ